MGVDCFVMPHWVLGEVTQLFQKLDLVIWDALRQFFHEQLALLPVSLPFQRSMRFEQEVCFAALPVG